jgi:hypothetical protein
MSKCDLAIQFDRADRTYLPGEEVTGTVRVQVNQDVRCDELLLETFWQTHGRGNSDTGPKQSVALYRGDWVAGTSHQYPFRFTAPDGPPTYHGHYLNIDQYVSIRVDIPWAIDPKRKEDYLLLPRTRPFGNLPRTTSKPGVGGFIASAGVPVGVGLIVLGMFCLFPFGFILIPAGLIILFFSLRKVLAEKRIGKVLLAWGATQVAPGSSVPVRMTFTPRKTSRLNGITAKLTATEKCTSGSGTNRTTHTHRVYERTVALINECDVVAHQPVQAEVKIPIPDTEAYSFAASDNELVWQVEVRIDIPLWPDWVEKKILTIRPAVQAQAEIAEPRAVTPPVEAGAETFDAAVREETHRAPPPAVSIDEPLFSGDEPLVPETSAAFNSSSQFDEPPEPASPVGPTPAVPTESTSNEGALLDIADRLLSASRFGPEREQLIQENSDQAFECTVEVDRVERMFGYVSQERFRNGRTVYGVLAGTECQLSLLMGAVHNEKLDACHPGDTVHATCKLRKWNNIYDRLDMEEV